MKLRLLVVLLVAASAFAGAATWNYVRAVNKPIHYHAAFKVYVNGVAVDFSGDQYMDIEPCSLEHDKNETTDPAHERLERAHLHDRIGDIVHVHRANVTWGALFENLGDQGFLFTEDRVEGYLDGKPVSFLFREPIRPYERMLVLVGDQSGVTEKMQTVPLVERIKEVEQRSETCGS